MVRVQQWSDTHSSATLHDEADRSEINDPSRGDFETKGRETVWQGLHEGSSAVLQQVGRQMYIEALVVGMNEDVVTHAPFVDVLFTVPVVRRRDDDFLRFSHTLLQNHDDVLLKDVVLRERGVALLEDVEPPRGRCV